MPTGYNWLEIMASAAKKLREADIMGAKKKTNEELILFVSGGNDGDERDAFAWGDVVREVKRRGLTVAINEDKYDFY